MFGSVTTLRPVTREKTSTRLLRHPVLTSPALQRRSVLRERRPVAVRRHTGRVATRFLVLLCGDVLALVVARVLLLSLSDAAVLRTGAWAATPFLLGATKFNWFVVITLMAVFATGGYSRHRALYQPIRLLVAIMGAVLLYWSGGIARGFFQQLASTMLATVGTTWVAMTLVRLASEWFLREVWPGQRGAANALFVGSPAASQPYAEAVAAPGGDYRVAGYIAAQAREQGDYLGTIDNLGPVIEEHDAEAVVVCADLPATRIDELIERCLYYGCQILFPARAVRVYALRPALVWHHDQPFFEIGSPVLRARALISKRLVDIVVGSFLLVLLTPLQLLIALAIRIDSPGSPLFFQERAGLGGRRFRMIKFRTMRVGADAEKTDLEHLNHTGDRRLFKIPDDPRTTRLGRFLRRWSLDELPQLLNVLIGEMSLVGPRPFFESDFADYEDHHFRRLDAKPGITGLWQVSGRSEVLNFEDVIYLDRQYIEQWSFWLDVSILFRTIPAVLRRRGAF